MPKFSVFISYAHEDGGFFKVFKKGLNSHLNTSDIDFDVWQDAEIPLGSVWEDEIAENLRKAQIAILCISANFLNSKYIEAKEFGLLKEKYPNTLIIPVYFNHCKTNSRWEELKAIQFFKPDGTDYGKATSTDFAFCDLVNFNSTDGGLIPNSNIDRYLQDFTNKIEERFSEKTKPADLKITGDNRITAEKNKPVKIIPIEPKKTSGFDNIVNITIVTFMIMSAIMIFYFLFFRAWNTESQYKSSLGGVLFFGSIGTFIFKQKNNKQAAI